MFVVCCSLFVVLYSLVSMCLVLVACFSLCVVRCVLFGVGCSLINVFDSASVFVCCLLCVV